MTMFSNTKFERIGDFLGGVDYSKTSENLRDTQLAECENMYYRDGELKTREGLHLIENFDLTKNSQDYFSLKALGNVAFSNDKSTKFFLVSSVEESVTYFRILVVHSNATKYCFSLCSFNSNSYPNGTTTNCFLFNGNAKKGSGVYIIFSIINSQNDVIEKTIYEINDSLSGVVKLSKSDVYVPTVYVNGKGTRFNAVEDKDLTYPKGTSFENFNGLTNAFKATFKTDGLSNIFELPFGNLSDDEGEDIMIYYTDLKGTKHTFTIDYNKDNSDYVTLGEKSVKITVNRSKGNFCVTDNTDTAYKLPFITASFNNLIILAYKSGLSDRIFKMSLSANYNSRVFLARNNCICFSQRNQPLYFPMDNRFYFGDEFQKITALRVQTDRLVVFKPYCVGLCSSISSASYDVNSVLQGFKNVTSTKENITISQINDNIGCTYPETIVNCLNRLVFLSSDNKVYTITSSSNYLQRLNMLSKPISNLLELNESRPFAFDLNGFYAICLKNDCFVFDYNTKNFISSSKPDWYKFKFYFNSNSGLFSSVSCGSDLTLIGKFYNSSGTQNIVLYNLDAKNDYYCYDGKTAEKHYITSLFRTKSFNINPSNLYGFGVEFGAFSNNCTRPVSVTLSTNRGAYQSKSILIKYPIFGLCVTHFPLRVNDVDFFSIEVEREGQMSVRAVDIKRKELRRKPI